MVFLVFLFSGLSILSILSVLSVLGGLSGLSGLSVLSVLWHPPQVVTGEELRNDSPTFESEMNFFVDLYIKKKRKPRGILKVQVRE